MKVLSISWKFGRFLASELLRNQQTSHELSEKFLQNFFKIHRETTQIHQISLKLLQNFLAFFIKVSLNFHRNFSKISVKFLYPPFFFWLYTHGQSVLITLVSGQVASLHMFCRKVVGNHRQDFKKLWRFLYKDLTVFTQGWMVNTGSSGKNLGRRCCFAPLFGIIEPNLC